MTKTSTLPLGTPKQIASSLLSMVVTAICLFGLYYLTAPFHRIIAEGIAETAATGEGEAAIATLGLSLPIIAFTLVGISISIGMAYLIAKIISPDLSYDNLLLPIIIAGMATVVLMVIHGLVTIHTQIATPQEGWIELETVTHSSIFLTGTLFSVPLLLKYRYGKKTSILRRFEGSIKSLENLLSSSEQTDSGQQAHQQGVEGHSQSSHPHSSTHDQQNPDELNFNWAYTTGISFDDVGGMKNLKESLYVEVIKPFEEVERARSLGIKPPNILFYGPPGTGKTHMAEALAGELNLPFVKLSGSDITTKWINESPARINHLFTEAKTVANSEGGAVIFLDELDSILKERSTGTESHSEDTKVVNELLNHLEESNTYGVIFIGATNRPDALDQAGTRSGRIDKKIEIGKPDTEAREEILAKLLESRNHRISIDHIHDIAQKTDGWVASDLELLVENAATNVFARDADDIISPDDLETALREMKQT